jgi:peptidoglycan-associated lipoprotein
MQLAVGLLAALFAAGSSQIVLVPPAPDGSRTEVDITWARGQATFDRQGYAFYLDKLVDVVYRIEDDAVEQEFGPALRTLQETVASGLPELPHSYAALLAPAKGDTGWLDIQVGAQAAVRLDQAGQSVYIDGYPNPPQPVDSQRLARDFGPALEMQSATLKTMGSYLVLLEHPDGGNDHLLYRHAGREYRLSRPGESRSLDGSEHPIERADLERDFTAALAVEADILAAGLPELAHSTAVLLGHTDGPAGEVDFVPTADGTLLKLRHPGEAVFIDGYPDAPHPLPDSQLQRDFGDTLTNLAQTRKTLRSYLVLMAPPTGAPGRLSYRIDGQVNDLTPVNELARTGDGLTLGDGLAFSPDPAGFEQDFSAALASQRAILAAGLPELAHSQVRLLAHEDGPLGEIDFQPGSGAARQTLGQLGQATFIDGYPDQPPASTDARLQRDFGDALVHLAQTRKTLRSYLYIPDAPEGPPGQITYRFGERTLALDQPGTGLTLGDAIEHVPEPTRYQQDFGPALASQRDILAAGLPELAHSRLVLLTHDMGPLGVMRFQPDHGGMPQTLSKVGTEVFIDGYPDTPHAADATRLRRDFGPTLAALSHALKSLRSYIVLLESPDGAASKVIYRTARDSRLLEHPGDSLTLDGIDHEPDLGLSEKDFGAAQTSTKQILDEGLPELAHSYVALVSHPAGGLGEVEIVEGIASGVVLAQAGEAVIIDGYSSKTYLLDAAHYRRDFGAALDATPPAPESHYLYFDSGSTRLAKESRAALQRLLESVRQHPAADITIAGHTDTVGGAELNERLSRKRSETIAEWIRASGAPYREIEMAAYGKSLLAIDTPDNTPELLNRRVEIVIR